MIAVTLQVLLRGVAPGATYVLALRDEVNVDEKLPNWPTRLLDTVFRVLNLDDDSSFAAHIKPYTHYGGQWLTGERYRRRWRSPMPGDVFVLGEQAYECQDLGWRPTTVHAQQVWHDLGQVKYWGDPTRLPGEPFREVS